MGKQSDMAAKGFGFLDWWAHRRVAQAWARAHRHVQRLAGDELRQLRNAYRDTIGHMRAVTRHADAELGAQGAQLSPSGPPGSERILRPAAWRTAWDIPGAVAPRSGQRFGKATAIFHDCAKPEIVLRQHRNTKAQDAAPFSVYLDVLRFEGSFLSVAIDIDPALLSGITKEHIVQMDLLLMPADATGLSARLNVRNGPNTEQILEHPRKGTRGFQFEFDLAYSQLNENRVDAGWIDLLIEDPKGRHLELRDCVTSRRMRTAL